MKKDLSSMTRAELEKLKQQVENAILEAAEKDKKAALAAAEKAAAEHGFSLAEITGGTGRKGKTGPKTAAAPKYRNPDDASQTWTGKGRQPQWFKSALANGTSPETMEI